MDPEELGELRRIGARVGAHADIRDLRFDSIAAKLVKEPVANLNYGFDIRPSVNNGELDEDHFAIAAQYDVNITQKGEAEGDKETIVAEISVTIAALFRIDPGDESGSFTGYWIDRNTGGARPATGGAAGGGVVEFRPAGAGPAVLWVTRKP